MFFRRLWFSVVAIASLWLLLGVLVPVSSSIQQRSRMSADQSRSLTSSAPPPSAAAAVLSSSWSSSLTKKHNNNNNPVRKNQYSKNKSPKNNNKMVARQNSKLECHPSQESIWLMNQCHHGYVAVLPDRRVVSLDANEPHNKLGKKREKNVFLKWFFLQEKSWKKKSIAKPCASFNGDDNNFFEKFISFKILQSVQNLFHPYVVSWPCRLCIL